VPTSSPRTPAAWSSQRRAVAKSAASARVWRGRGLGAPDHRALHRRHALRGTRLPGLPLQDLAEAGQRAAPFLAQPAFLEGAFAGQVKSGELVGLVHLRQVGGHARVGGRQGARDSGDQPRPAQRFVAVLSLLQRLPPLHEQAVQAALQAAPRHGVGRIAPLQGQEQRDRIVGGLEPATPGQRAFGPPARLSGLLRRDGNGRRLPVQFVHAAVVAADRHPRHAHGRFGVLPPLRRRRPARAGGQQRQRQQQESDGAQTTSVHPPCSPGRVHGGDRPWTGR